MKKNLFLLFTLLFISINSNAQDRIDSTPTSLSYKSKEITNAKFWSQNTETGKWKSRKNTKHVYLGEGVAVDNFYSLFIGEYQERRYLFMDFRKFDWRYPNLKQEWMYYRNIMAASITEEDYIQMSNIKTNELITISPRFYYKMFKGHNEYSFPFFLSLVETLHSSSETLFKSYERSDSTEFAEKQYKEKYPTINFIVIKRTTDSKGNDLVRFRLYPSAMKELIDHSYFEIEYSVYNNLFIEDKLKAYK